MDAVVQGAVVLLVCTLCAGAPHNGLSHVDLERANQARPELGSHVLGPHPAAAFERMNDFLKQEEVKTRSCESWTHEDLNEVGRAILSSKHEALDVIYRGRSDRRKMRADADTIKAAWDAEQHLSTSNPTLFGIGTEHYNVTRDGKCAELVMWWIHHLSEDSKTLLSSKASFSLPLLPSKVVETEDATYNQQITCSDCHTTGNISLPDSKKEALGLAPRSNVQANVSCPVDPNTGVPAVWYHNASDAGNRRKRCDSLNYGPPCQMCEGVGGLAWGDQQDQINYTYCKPVMAPADIPADNLTSPVWPKAFTVMEHTTLINQINTGGRFPGADPCAPHKFENQTEVQYYDGSMPASRIHTYGLLDTSDIWALPNANMYIKIERVYCICVTPSENGDGKIPIGPLRYDFANDSVLIGREMIGLEWLNKIVLADHWNKGPHHFWIDVATNLMVRGWQPYNGLNVYSDWDLSPPDPSHFVVDKSCNSGLLHKNISCIGPP